MLFVDYKFIKPVLQHAHHYVELYDLTISSGIYSLIVHSYFRAISIETDIYGSYAKHKRFCSASRLLIFFLFWAVGSMDLGKRLQIAKS